MKGTASILNILSIIVLKAMSCYKSKKNLFNLLLISNPLNVFLMLFFVFNFYVMGENLIQCMGDC